MTKSLILANNYNPIKNTQQISSHILILESQNQLEIEIEDINSNQVHRNNHQVNNEYLDTQHPSVFKEYQHISQIEDQNRPQIEDQSVTIIEDKYPRWKTYVALILGIIGLILVPLCLVFIFI